MISLTLALATLALTSALPPEAQPVAPPAVEPTPLEPASEFVPVALGFHVFTRARATDTPPHTQLELRRARFNLNLRANDWLSARLELDGADPPTLIKDVYLELTVTPWLTLTAGQFKKPFSALQLTSIAALPLWRRGTAQQHLVEDLRFGGRDRGVMASGEVSGLLWALGVFNGSGPNAEVDSGKDVTARLSAKVSRALRLGLSGALKYRNAAGLDLVRRDTYAAELDARLRVEGLEALVELLWGMDGAAPEVRQSAAAVGYVAYLLPWAGPAKLQPLAKLEALNTGLRQGSPWTWSATVGFNVHLWGRLRVMVQAEVVRTRDTAEFTLHPEHAPGQVVVQLAYSEWVELKGAPR